MVLINVSKKCILRFVNGENELSELRFLVGSIFALMRGKLDVNDSLSFKGGGISFDDGISEYLNQGDLIIHSSKVKNSELEIYEGNKYVLVAYIDLSI